MKGIYVRKILEPVDNKPAGNNAHISVMNNAAVLEANSLFEVNWIVSIVNDGNDEIIFNFDAVISGPGAFSLKPGEALNDFPRTCTTLYYKAVSGTQPFRALGVRKI